MSWLASALLLRDLQAPLACERVFRAMKPTINHEYEAPTGECVPGLLRLTGVVAVVRENRKTKDCNNLVRAAHSDPTPQCRAGEG